MLPQDGSLETQDIAVFDVANGMHPMIWQNQPIAYAYYNQLTSSGSEIIKTINLIEVEKIDHMESIREQANYLKQQAETTGQISLLSTLKNEAATMKGSGKGKKGYYMGRSQGKGRAEPGNPIHGPDINLVSMLDGIDPANRLRRSSRMYNAP